MKVGVISHNKQEANNFLNSLLATLPVEEIKLMTMTNGRRCIYMDDGTEYEVLDSDLDLLEDYQAIRFYLSTRLPETYSLEVSFRCRDVNNSLSPFIIYF
jgi:hypothetical protein